MDYNFEYILAAVLKALVPGVSIYVKSSKQKTKFPAFFINRIRTNSSRGLKKRINSCSYDIVYINEPCDIDELNNLGEQLLLIDNVEVFSLREKEVSIEEDVLHFQFDVSNIIADAENEEKIQKLNDLTFKKGV